MEEKQNHNERHQAVCFSVYGTKFLPHYLRGRNQLWSYDNPSQKLGKRRCSVPHTQILMDESIQSVEDEYISIDVQSAKTKQTQNMYWDDGWTHLFNGWCKVERNDAQWNDAHFHGHCPRWLVLHLDLILISSFSNFGGLGLSVGKSLRGVCGGAGWDDEKSMVRW